MLSDDVRKNFCTLKNCDNFNGKDKHVSSFTRNTLVPSEPHCSSLLTPLKPRESGRSPSAVCFQNAGELQVMPLQVVLNGISHINLYAMLCL